ncbi:MAG TPA: ribosome maturation factor RimM [Candidatus Evtepia faecigallinarum]|nr:ribosome maturation factor RimM [Candidatus Evtepia faecigallinarum]
MKNRYLEAGKIVNTHGIAGEVKILPWADGPEFLLDFDTLYIDGQPMELTGARVHKNCVLAKLAGIDDINQAMKLRDKIVCIDREDVELEEGAFFLADLMGLEVRQAETGKVLGTIHDILTPPANNVYVVRGGEREYMIPAVPAFILETNIDDGYLLVRLIEGM